ncbi:putative pectinesterase/pectinesterase inhibitor 54 [Morus notabilis]|uniref:Pectinesterase n=1 Tax=Morus notabilis TaxID=981085 RepID=W9S3W6_9ROSA|nr:pectinesterase isoform X1 [Morus notabilis]EXC13610.1 putative pectinesterase/pectinesterase inhibitor 54 [Morus notabilis]
MIRNMLEHYFVVFWALLGYCALGVANIDNRYSHQLQHEIQSDCHFTRYPSLCVQTLLALRPGSYHYTDVISALVNKTIEESKLPSSTSDDFSTLNSQLGAEAAKSAQSITGDCEALMSLSVKRLRQSLTAIKQSPTKKKEDIQTWLSAALTFQQACKDSADGLTLASQISKKMSYLTELSSNALALTNRITGSKSPEPFDAATHTARGRLKGQIFPKWVSPRDRKLLQSTTINANAVVAQDGSGNYKTISEAIRAASGGRFVIYVKAGVYKEKIHASKDGITLIGEGKYTTIITGDDSVAGGSSMPGSATFTVTGDGFIARDIGFHNTAGSQGEQALALYIASDHSALYRCSIAGYQDTLYALALRQFYRECDIYGTVDFIFGNAAAVFQKCNLALRRPSGANVILANGRSDPGQNTGFSVQNCQITASSEFSAVKHSYESYLGRPWKAYSRAVVMQSNIDDAIEPRGWIEWPGYGSSVLKSLYFAEYANVGPGAGTSQRVTWPGFHVIGVEDAEKFTVANFIAGNSWLSSTKVAFDSGL